MSSSVVKTDRARATDVRVTDETLTVELSDGRTISVPLGWYPRLAHGTPEERANWRPIGDAEGIHWPELDEDVSVEGLLLGKPSAESQKSLARWLEERSQRLRVSHRRSPSPPRQPAGPLIASGGVNGYLGAIDGERSACTVSSLLLLDREYVWSDGCRSPPENRVVPRQGLSSREKGQPACESNGTPDTLSSRGAESSVPTLREEAL